MTTATESGGTVSVAAGSCRGDNVTSALMMITRQGKPLVYDITEQGARCTQAAEIDATRC